MTLIDNGASGWILVETTAIPAAAHCRKSVPVTLGTCKLPMMSNDPLSVVSLLKRTWTANCRCCIPWAIPAAFHTYPASEHDSASYRDRSRHLLVVGAEQGNLSHIPLFQASNELHCCGNLRLQTCLWSLSTLF